MDCGIFCKRLPRVFLECCARHGAQRRVIEYVASAFEGGSTHEQIVAGVQKMNPTDGDRLCAGMKDLKKIAPYIYNIHGKFYEMTDELREYSIPYDEIIPVLTEMNYAYSIDSEYEGQRWIQDAVITDSCEQVRPGTRHVPAAIWRNLGLFMALFG